MLKKYFIFMALVCALLPAMAHGANNFLWEGFERENNWFSADAASGRVVDAEIFSEGRHSLKLPFKTVAKSGKAVYGRNDSADWSPYGALLLDVYNPTDLKDLKCSLLIYTQSRWVEHEVALPPLVKGWNRDLRVDFSVAKFSTPATGHEPVGYLVGRGEFQGLGFLVKPGEAAEGALYLDNIRLERSGVVKLGDLTLNTTIEGMASGGDLAYLPPGMRLQASDFSLIESFETGAMWSSAQPGVLIEQSGETKSQGKFGLSVTFPQLPGGFDVYFNGIESRLAGSRQLRMDVYNPGSSIGMTLWMTDMQGNYYSSYRTIDHGWNTPVFDFSNQSSWNGAVIDDSVLSNLSSVGATIYAAYAGSLVFDGLSASSIFTRNAGKLNLLASLSYNPSPDFEVIADTRLEDTFYGTELSNARDAGVDAYMDAAGLRWDQGAFRTKATYRRRVTAFDHPITSLLSSDRFGQEITALEEGGHLGNVEVQALALSRLEYGHYNSRLPTGLGPENVEGLRARTKVWEGGRIGSTFYNHQASYGKGVSGLPGSRQTFGLDLDSLWKAGPLSVTWAMEGAGTSGDRHLDLQNVYAPPNDNYYGAVRVNPQWGRLSVDYYYSLTGYEFDGDFAQYGGNAEWQWVQSEFKLEDFGFLKAIKRLPFYDQSLGNNLRMVDTYFVQSARTGYQDPNSPGSLPSYREQSNRINMDNDSKAKPHFRLQENDFYTETQWSISQSRAISLNIRLPLWFEFQLSLTGGHREGRDSNKAILQSGLSERVYVDGGLEWHSASDLSLSVTTSWNGSSKSWEGDWGPYEQHIKWSASLEQTLGPQSVLRLDFGRPALLGYDFGLQDTIQVLTLSGKIYL